jgi:hypothetical protein
MDGWGGLASDPSPGWVLSAQPPSTYEDSKASAAYEDQNGGSMGYEDGGGHAPDPFGLGWPQSHVSQQPRGTAGVRLGPEPEVANLSEIHRARSIDITKREVEREYVKSPENGVKEVDDSHEGALVKGDVTHSPPD